jgi:hypothetical protein
MMRRQCERKSNRMALRRIQIAILCSAGICGVSIAQATDPTVEWVASWAGNGAVTHGSVATLELSAEVQQGWHVYALSQPPRPVAPYRCVSLSTTTESSGLRMRRRVRHLKRRTTHALTWTPDFIRMHSPCACRSM